jgi:alkaline phosphatase D
MKHFYSLLIFLISLSVFSQKPSYQEVLQNEIVSNEIQNTSEARQKPYVVMVSIDGFRYDYAQKYSAKNLLDMAEKGSSVERLIPSFPSKTFPNHYTLVTGLYPENHGIVANSFFDKVKKEEYRISNRKVVEDGGWYGGVPLWNLAQLNGMCAASYFWVGSEANINGLHPKYYYSYNKQTPYEYRVQRVLEWLRLPEELRPHFVTLYFSLVDTQGHTYGPDSEETKKAVQYIDEQIGVLRKGLAESGLPVSLIVTSDHGMANVNKHININNYLKLRKEQFYGGPVAMIYTDGSAETEDFFHRLQKKDDLRVYKKEAMPSYLHFNKGDQIGDLVLVTDPPNTIIYSEKSDSEMEKPGGTHGYDPFISEEMGAILYIEGPKIRENFRLSPVENIHVYPLVAHLLGLNLITPVDGQFDVLAPVLKTCENN